MFDNKEFNFQTIFKAFKVLMKFVYPYKKRLIVVSLLIIVGMIDSLLTPYVWGKLIDGLTELTLGQDSLKVIILSLVIWGILAIVRPIADHKKVLKEKMIRENIRIDYLTTSYKKIYDLPMSFHKNSKSGETLHKITSAASGIESLFSTILIESFPPIVTALIGLIILFIIKPIIGLSAIVVIFFYVYIAGKEIKAVGKIQRELQKEHRFIFGLINDTINNIRAVKDYAYENLISNKIKKHYKEVTLPILYRLVNKNRTSNIYQGVLLALFRIAVLIFCITLIYAKTMSIGQMVQINVYITLLFTPLFTLIANVRLMQTNIIAMEDNQIILNSPNENYQNDISNLPQNLVGKIEFKNVTFGYDTNHKILNDVTFSAIPGEVIALVGESGVGKSTLLDLILAYYFPTAGEILVDSINTKNISLGLLRKNIAIVSQEITLFNDTIFNNILYGRPDATKEEVELAAQKACATDFINRLPDKWQQSVGEKGFKLSVGQKQRIAIARAILKNPKILILDEPTSALDSKTEKEISNSLEELMKGKTTIIIAHRLSTVRRADKIIVLKEGAIIESGKHTELLNKSDGEYKRLHDIQMGHK